MPLKFLKIKECSCIVFAIVFEIKDTEKGRMYFLGAHDYYSICNKCKELEEMNDEDTLDDMWCNDYITDDFEYAGWKIYKNSV